MSILRIEWITRGILSQQREKENIFYQYIFYYYTKWYTQLVTTEGNYSKLIKGPTIEGEMLKTRK